MVWQYTLVVSPTKNIFIAPLPQKLGGGVQKFTLVPIEES